MWPWEHLAFGYLLYSTTVRMGYRRAPAGMGALVLAVATQFPDLIDKPGAWVFDVLPSGTSVAHSVFVAVPLSLLALVIARRRGRTELGFAVAIGYLSHLVGDIVYPAFIGGGLAIGSVTWPLGPTAVGRTKPLVPMLLSFWSTYVDYLASPAGIGYVLLELSLLGLGLGLWVADGKPGLVTLRRLGTQVLSRG